MDAQEIFDKAVMGVIKQGGPSRNDNGGCLYRGPNGLKCAAGHLISDDEYDSDTMMNMAWENIAHFFPQYKQHYNLIRRLQNAHDESSPASGEAFIKEFKKKTKRIAISLNLNIPW